MYINIYAFINIYIGVYCSSSGKFTIEKLMFLTLDAQNVTDSVWVFQVYSIYIYIYIYDFICIYVSIYIYIFVYTYIQKCLYTYRQQQP
jgi:hypothetical protein